jgi:phosphate transport system substrate-binding protein
MVVVSRDETSGTGDVWKDVLGIDGDILADNVTQKSNSGVLAFVAENKNAIGYISAAFLNNEVKALSVNGVSHKKINKNASYPIYRDLYFYVNKKKFNETIRSFITFVMNARGQELIKELGFVSISEE